MQLAPLNSFDEVIKGEFHNKKIKLKCIIVGKTLVPYHVPKTVKVQCISAKCKCELKSEVTFDIDAVDNKILTFIDEKKTSLERLVRDAMEIGCPKIQVEVVTMQSIERIYITRATGKERTRKGGGSRAAYVVGQSLETNSVYEFDGYTTTDPKTQHATHVFTYAKKMSNDIESFNLSTKKHSELNEFCVSDKLDSEAMLSKLVDLYERYAYNITKIYERDDLHLVVDMLFRSVISFQFDKEKVNKGWIDAMIIGDTRCGKGFVAEKLVEWFGLGEVVSGENCLGGDTEIITKEHGLVKIKDVCGEITLLDSNGNWVKSTIKSYGKQKTVLLRFTKNKRNIFIRSTLNHDWKLTDGSTVRLNGDGRKGVLKLKRSAKIPFIIPKRSIEDDSEYFLGIVHGIVYGDGCKVKDRNYYKLRLCGEKDRELIQYFTDYTISYYPKHNGDAVVYVTDHGINLKELPSKNVSDEYLIGFLRGWLAADGSVNVVNNSTQACRVSLMCKEDGLNWIKKVLPRIGYYNQGYNKILKGGYGFYKEPRYSIYLNIACFSEDDFLISKHRNKFLNYIDWMGDYHYTFREIVQNSEEVEEVYCAIVPTTRSFVLNEGLLTGNCSFAGLVGGLQQLGKQWAITWGKIPLNDCGLLVIDETSGMVEDMWGKLSRVRSEGVAEITKIQTEIANARTRLLFICNALNKSISHYPFGIQAVPDMIKAPEDIARFDYVLVVAHNEVEGKDINRPRTGKPLLYSQKLEQELILWCWSRKADEVKFTDEAISSIYEISLKISDTYDFSIPLIQVENIRFKLAKLAIAFAARFYSNSENGKNLVVKPIHVECAAIFFDVIYRKEQSGYYQYSKMKKSELDITSPEKLKEIEVYFNSWDLQKEELLKCLLQNTYIDHNDISVHLGVRKELGIECVSKLLKAGCLHKKGNSYVKASEFTAYLKKRLLERRR